MWKWIGVVVLVLAALVAVVALIGTFLPQGHVATRSASYRQTPDAIFRTITDVAAGPAWRKDVTRVELLPAVNGRTRFREHSSQGPVTFEIVEAVPGSRVVSRIADPDLPFGGTWTYEIVPDGIGARLTITERGEVYNPIFRFMSTFVFSQTATMEQYLVALGEKFGERVVPDGK